MRAGLSGTKMSILLLAAGAALLAAAYLAWHLAGPGSQGAAPGKSIICFGDSLTAGTGASPAMDYPSQLSNLMGEPVINAGVPGDTTRDAAARLDQDVLSRSPRIVIVVLGVNDISDGVPREEMFANLKAIVERIQARGADVVVGGLSMRGGCRGCHEAFKELCRETGALLVPDIYAGIMGRGHLMSDSVHPNDKGYQIIAERFYGAVREPAR
jgi:acyl-CoA thioesterase I